MNKSVQSMLETVQNVFEAAHTAASNMAEGERVQVKELAQTVGLAVAMDPKKVLDFVNFFAHNSDVVYVTRGKKGGVVKGTRPAKVVKVKKAPKDAPVADVASE